MTNLKKFKVHADASNFAANFTKEEAYQQVLDQAEGLFYEQRNWQLVQLRCPSLARLQVTSCSEQPGQLGWFLHPQPLLHHRTHPRPLPRQGSLPNHRLWPGRMRRRRFDQDHPARSRR
ncbi:hypothetical protein SMAC4_03230 [Sordaria macrospora]|uniref:uncharacterized protein n=1 Tax=Sordaria macrospora TaxID=5147 RepID=UPI002B2A522E|nr:hypothetical protein SMAC4_03230 [Sordaria macrospora]